MTRAAVDALAESARGNPVALANLARALLARGESEQARELANEALAADPGDAQVAALAAEVLAHGVPDWHFSIVRDDERNDAYDSALRRAIGGQTRVLEIGSGSGLLAMMAARAGAAEVITCEMDPAVADAARRVIEANGYTDRIRVIAKHSADLDPDLHLGGPVDLLVSEIVSNDVVAQGVLPAYEQVVRRLLRPGGAVIPARVTVRVAPAEDRELHRRRMTTAAGFDLSEFNVVAADRHRIQAGDARLRQCGDAVDLFTFDLRSGGPFPEAEATAESTVDAAGVNGVAQWLAIDLDDATRYENRPTPGRVSCWAVWFHPFSGPFPAAPGDTIRIGGSHDRVRLRIWAAPA
jgi:predicted RNA methylase